MRKFHPEISPEALRIRAFIHTIRRLSPTHSTLNKKEKKLEAGIAKLEAACPSRCGPRQMLVQDLGSIMATWRSEGRELSASVQKSVIRNHMQIWDNLSAGQRRSFELASQAHIADREQVHARDLAALEAALQDIHRRGDEQRRQPGSLQLSTAQWSQHDLDTMETKRAFDEYDEPCTVLRRELVEKAPVLLDAGMLKDMDDLPVYRPEPAFQRPMWLGKLAEHRDWFEGSAIGFELPTGEEVWYAFMFGRQDEHHVEFSKLVAIDSAPEPRIVTSETWQDLSLDALGS